MYKPEKSFKIKSENVNEEIVLFKHSSSVPTKDTFGILETDIPKLEEGQVLLKTLYVSSIRECEVL